MLHDDKVAGVKHLGTVRISLDDINDPEEKRILKDSSLQSDCRWWKLEPLPTSNFKGPRGELFLSILRYPTQSQKSVPCALLFGCSRAQLPPVLVSAHSDVPPTISAIASTHNFKLTFLMRPSLLRCVCRPIDTRSVVPAVQEVHLGCDRPTGVPLPECVATSRRRSNILLQIVGVAWSSTTTASGKSRTAAPVHDERITKAVR